MKPDLTPTSAASTSSNLPSSTDEAATPLPKPRTLCSKVQKSTSAPASANTSVQRGGQRGTRRVRSAALRPKMSDLPVREDCSDSEAESEPELKFDSESGPEHGDAREAMDCTSDVDPQPVRADSDLGAAYTSHISTLHGRHPAVAWPHFKRAALRLGRETVWHLQDLKQAGCIPAGSDADSDPRFTLDAPMSDKVGPYRTATGMWDTAPPLAFPLVTVYQSSKADRSTAQKDVSISTSSELPRKVQRMQDGDVIRRSVLIPLHDRRALIFPGDTFEQLALQPHPASISSEAGAPALKGRMVRIGTEDDDACCVPTDSGASDTSGERQLTAFELTREPYIASTRRLRCLLEERVCDDHLPVDSYKQMSSHPNPQSALQDTEQLGPSGPSGPVAGCEKCSNKSEALTKLQQQNNTVAHPSCATPKSVSDLYLERRASQYGAYGRYALDQKAHQARLAGQRWTTSGRAVTSRAWEDEVEEAKRKLVHHRPKRWYLPVQDWEAVRRAGVYVAAKEE